MNILVPVQWLKDHVKTTASPEEMQRLLSLSGPSVERIHEEKNDKVMEIEVTTNRMDTASIRGIAREAAVILKQAGKGALLQPIATYQPKTGEVISNPNHFPIHIKNDPKLCSRVTCVVLNVKKKNSPTWMKERLEQVGIRSLNNLIDVTNYVMTELGQPAHAFDADRLGNTMIIREAKKGETLVTLDDKEHTMIGGEIVVDNGKGELTDLIGIMGTANSVVTDDTTRILFFIEHSDPMHIRKASMGHAIRTNAAQLNEKMIDPNLVMEALLRGISLYQEVAEAVVASPILDLYPDPIKPHTIHLPFAKTETYLGLKLPTHQQTQILKDLGCDVAEGKEGLRVTVLTLRPDLEIPVDLVEEIARIYGYHNLPSALMDTPIPTIYPEDTDFALEHRVKQFLANIGWQEVYTYSAVSETLALQSGASLDQHLKLQNPLNDDHVYLRRTLVPSHLEVIQSNTHLKQLSIFELANVYLPKAKDLPEESLRLTLTSTKPMREVKGDVEALFDQLYIPKDSIRFKQDGDTHAEVWVGKTMVGSLIAEPVRKVTIAGFAWKQLLKVAQTHPTYQPISQYSPIIEDMTFTISERVHIGDIVKSMKTLDPLVQSVEVKSVFNQNVSFTVKYHSKTKQVATEDVEPVRGKLKKLVVERYKAVLVGKP
jgi:phenylalanyl-tRNA synthetase beta chain